MLFIYYSSKKNDTTFFLLLRFIIFTALIDVNLELSGKMHGVLGVL